MTESNAPESALENPNETTPMTSQTLADDDEASKEAPNANVSMSERFPPSGIRVTPPPDDFGFSSPPASSLLFSPFVFLFILLLYI